MKRSAVVLACALFGACLNLNVPQPEDHPTDPATETFAAATGVDISKMTKLPSGVYILDVQVGTGNPITTRTVANVSYVAYLTNGFVWERVSQPRSVDLNQVAVAGFTEGVLGMRAGGTRKIVIPSALGFGKNAVPSLVIPANSTLIYDVQLITF